MKLKGYIICVLCRKNTKVEQEIDLQNIIKDLRRVVIIVDMSLR